MMSNIIPNLVCVCAQVHQLSGCTVHQLSEWSWVPLPPLCAGDNEQNQQKMLAVFGAQVGFPKKATISRLPNIACPFKYVSIFNYGGDQFN